MKAFHRALTVRVFLAAQLLFAFASLARAQSDNDLVPVVTVRATDPVASWSGDTGTFTIFRHGNTNLTLNVFCRIEGSASNGVDYALIPNWVNIPAGETSASVTVTPLNQSSSNMTKTVVLELAPSPLMIPVNYEIGSPKEAVVYITDDPSNFPPLVSIEAPADGAVFYTPTNIFISAAVAYGDAPPPDNVEFFANDADLGSGKPYVSSGFGGMVGLAWTNPPAGKFALTAVASYDEFQSRTSAPVHIAIRPGPTPTNQPPRVRIVSPTNGQSFLFWTNMETFARQGIHLFATASDWDGGVTNVEFFADGIDLGAANLLVLDPPGVNGVTGPVFTSPWYDPPAGDHVLTAVATDNKGASTSSEPVHITVHWGGSPTNQPPEVRITSPADEAVFRAPVNIPIYAFAADRDGQVKSVEFFANDKSVGLGQPLVAPAIVCPDCPPFPDFGLVWSNAPLGTNIELTAKATDDLGATTTSSPVSISILPSPPPPTNRPAVLGIVATDPIAIKGTNAWPWRDVTGTAPNWSDWTAPTATWCYFTNRGPKTATIAVFRHGATNEDLNVTYHIGGTASNGVDYVSIPGKISIPAGLRRADISIVPIDDETQGGNKTVVLRLEPGDNYSVGIPRAAAVLILDHVTPWPHTGIMADGSFHLRATGPNGAWFHIESSTDLVHWTSVCTNQVVNGSIDFVDPDAGGATTRFYRAVPDSGPPPE